MPRGPPHQTPGARLQLGDECRLASGRRAGIEQNLARLRIEQGYGQQCARILHVEAAVLK